MDASLEPDQIQMTELESRRLQYADFDLKDLQLWAMTACELRYLCVILR